MQTITVSSKIIDQIITRLDKLTNEVKVIKTRLFEEEPPYGSDEWWEWSDKKELKSIKEGKGSVIHNKKELEKWAAKTLLKLE